MPKISHSIYTNRGESLIPYLVLSLLYSGVQILSVPFPKQQVTRNICWSAQTISPSGLKLNLWRTSEMWTLRNLFGKMLSLDLGSLTPSSWTMAFSLTTNPLGYIVVNWELRTYILPQSILKETDKPKLLIRSQLMESRKGQMMRKENGRKTCHTSCGYIEPRLADQQGKPPFQ